MPISSYCGQHLVVTSGIIRRSGSQRHHSLLKRQRARDVLVEHGTAHIMVFTCDLYAATRAAQAAALQAFLH